MASQNIKIKGTIEIEPLVKLECLNVGCIHNLAKISEGYYCNLKRLYLNADGACESQMLNVSTST
ncbi:MAG: hypothetical protein DRI46_12325 [Chloroflexi bacterium]|nr:MAG: hypothetical protein DRI46_12325 [Chloroflexota bacterium]